MLVVADPRPSPFHLHGWRPRRDTGEFCPPDPRALAVNVGPSDGAMGFGCLQARVAEALSLIGAHDLALAYTEADALVRVRRFDAPLHVALARGRVLAARGDASAATTALESAAAAAREAGVLVLEVKALQLALEVAAADSSGGGGGAAEAEARLAAALRRMKGSAREITSVFHGRDNTPTLDAEALLAAHGGA